MDSSHTFYIRTKGVTPEEVLEDHRSQSTPIGNDLDLLQQATWLIMAGHYREAMAFTSRVQPSSDAIEDLPEVVDKLTAQAAFIAAHERAQSLFEEAALDIEGKSEGSETMKGYFKIQRELKASSDWW